MKMIIYWSWSRVHNNNKKRKHIIRTGKKDSVALYRPIPCVVCMVCVVCVVGVCVYFYLCTDFFFRSHTHIPTTTNFDAFFKYTWFYVQNIFTWKILNHSFCQMRMHTPWWYTCVNISTYTPCIDTYFVYFLLKAYMCRQYIYIYINIYWYLLCSHAYSAPRYVPIHFLFV